METTVRKKFAVRQRVSVNQRGYVPGVTRGTVKLRNKRVAKDTVKEFQEDRVPCASKFLKLFNLLTLVTDERRTI